MSEPPALPPSSEIVDATTGEPVRATALKKRTIILSELTKVAIDSPSLGQLEFRQITIGSLTDLEKRLKQSTNASDRDLVVEVLQLHLVTLSTEASLAELPEAELFAIAVDWGSRKGTLDTELAIAEMPGAFAGAVRDLPKKTLAKIREVVSPLATSWLARPVVPPGFTSPMIELHKQIAKHAAFERSIGLHTSQLVAMKEAALLKNILPHSLVTSGVMKSIGEAMDRVRVESQLLRGLTHPWPSMQQSIADAMRLRDRAAEAASIFGVRSGDRMVRRLDSVATSVEHVWTDWAEASRIPVDGFAQRLEEPSTNLLNASVVTETLLAEDGSEDALEVLSHDPLALDALIIEWRPSLLEPLKGSRHALNSRGPDYIRQHGASLRELMRAALHALAPDAEVLSWAQQNQLIDNKGRPTRRARVTFICTLGTPTPYADLVTRVVDHYLSVVDFLDKGVHRIQISAPDDQHAKLQVAQRNAENVLRQLISLRLLRG
jgi:hypothetical protein